MERVDLNFSIQQLYLFSLNMPIVVTLLERVVVSMLRFVFFKTVLYIHILNTYLFH